MSARRLERWRLPVTDEPHPHAPPEPPPDTGEQLPPADLDAEAIVISHALGHGVEGISEHVRPNDFWSEANRLIFSAIQALCLDGRAIEATAVRRLLSERGQLDRVGGTPYLLQLLDSTPATAYPADYARTIADKARVRRMIEEADRIRIQGYQSNGSSAAYLAHALESVRIIAEERPTAGPFAWCDGAAIAKPLAPIPWVVPGLCVGPGRPTLLAGYGFSGKSIIVQALLLAVASGSRAFGELVCRQGKVLHLDYEQGAHATNLRYQRLAFAAGIDLAALGPTLRVAHFPTTYLTSADAETAMQRECAGVSLCVVDSFRAATPGAEENDSAIRAFLDMLTRVSERTGCAMLVVHHSGKTPMNGEKKPEAERARGSSGIFDACGTVANLASSAPYEPIRVTLAKVSASAEGRQTDPFYLAFSDVPDDDATDPRAGLRVEYQSADQVCQPTSPETALRRATDEVLTYLRAHPGSSRNVIAEGTGIRRQTVTAALESLEQQGRVTSERATGAHSGGGVLWAATHTTITND